MKPIHKIAIISTLFALLITPLNSSAQDLYFGLKAGLNLTNVTANDMSDVNYSQNTKTKVGANIGGVVGYQISDVLAIEILPNYSFQGYKLNYISTPQDSPSEEYNTSINLDYLKIPITAKLFIYDGIYAQSGLSFNFLISALEDLEPIKGLNVFDLSIPIAVGYKFNRHLDFSLQYDISLSRFNPNQAGANRNFSINLAWIF